MPESFQTELSSVSFRQAVMAEWVATFMVSKGPDAASERRALLLCRARDECAGARRVRGGATTNDERAACTPTRGGGAAAGAPSRAA